MELGLRIGDKIMVH